MRFVTILAMILAVGMSAVARAGDYPAQPITLVIPFSVGGPTDTIARTVASSMQKQLRQPIVVESITGAGGTIAAARVARARPDGYTMMLHHIGMAASPALYADLGYDPMTDFEPIGEVTDVPMTLIGRRGLPAATLSELLHYIGQEPRGVSIAHAGPGSASYLCALLFMNAADVKLNAVGYKGTAPALTDVLGGRRDLLCDQTTNSTTHIRSGKVKAYGTTTARRVSLMQDVPTLDEAGLKKFEMTVWHALYVPRGTPPEIVAKLSDALRFALADSTVQARFKDLGTNPVALEKATPDYARRHLESETVRWRAIIGRVGRTLE